MPAPPIRECSGETDHRHRSIPKSGMTDSRTPDIILRAIPAPCTPRRFRPRRRLRITGSFGRGTMCTFAVCWCRIRGCGAGQTALNDARVETRQTRVRYLKALGRCGLRRARVPEAHRTFQGSTAFQPQRRRDQNEESGNVRREDRFEPGERNRSAKLRRSPDGGWSASRRTTSTSRQLLYFGTPVHDACADVLDLHFRHESAAAHSAISCMPDSSDMLWPYHNPALGDAQRGRVHNVLGAVERPFDLPLLCQPITTSTFGSVDPPASPCPRRSAMRLTFLRSNRRQRGWRRRRGPSSPRAASSPSVVSGMMNRWEFGAVPSWDRGPTSRAVPENVKSGRCRCI